MSLSRIFRFTATIRGPTWNRNHRLRVSFNVGLVCPRIVFADLLGGYT